MHKNIVAIIGSASKDSSNLKLVQYIASIMSDDFSISIFNALSTLPHFNPEQTDTNTPTEITAIGKLIEEADGILICTPEYVFSIPSGLKNLIEWCVYTAVFSKKPMGLITASAQGEKCHEELQLIMRTVEADFTEDTCLLIQGIKGKIDLNGVLRSEELKTELHTFVEYFENRIQQTPN